MSEELYPNTGMLRSSHKFAKNSIYNVTGFIVTFPILILLTPYMLKVLGKAQFGIWAIAGVVTSYAQLSDLGMTTAIVKYVAEHWAKKDVDGINRVVSTTFFSFAAVGGSVAAVLLLARHFIVINLLKVQPDIQTEALFVVSGIVIIFYFNLLFSVYSSILLGLQRMDVTNSIMVSAKVLRAMGMWFFLSLGFGLSGLIINGAIFSLLNAVINLYWAKRLVKGLRVTLSNCSFHELRRILRYSVSIFTANIFSNLAMEPSSKIILAYFTSLTNIVYFEIGQKIQSFVRGIFQVGLFPMLPASSEMKSLNDINEIRKLYFQATRFIFFFGLPLFLVVIIFANTIINFWLGEGYELAADAIKIFLIGHFCSLFITPQYILFQGIGKPHLSIWISGVSSVINILCSFTLVIYFGFYGALFAYSTSLIVGALTSLFLFEKHMHINVVEICRQISLPGIIAVLIFGGALSVAGLHYQYMNFLTAISTVLILLGCYIISLFSLKIFNDEERSLIFSVWSNLRLRFSFSKI